MLRAARFSAKLGFSLHPDTRAPIGELNTMLANIPSARLFEEVLKLLQTGHAQESYKQLCELDLLRFLFPGAEHQLSKGDAFFARLIEQALANTDERIAIGKPVTPTFLYAVFLWPQVREAAEKLQHQGEAPTSSYYLGADQVLPQQLRATSLPKRFSVPMREIWAMQPRLMNTTGKRALRLLGHPRFRAGYDFLCLREQAGQDLQNCSQWWTQLQENTPNALPPEQLAKKPRRRYKPANRTAATD